MPLAFDKISETLDDTPVEGVVVKPPWWHSNRVLRASPSGNFVAGFGEFPSGEQSWVVDTSASPPVLVWSARQEWDLGPDIGADNSLYIHAVDDEGSAWCDCIEDATVVEILPDGSEAIARYEFVDFDYGSAASLLIRRIFTLTLSDGTIKVVIFPQSETTSTPNPYAFVGTKGVEGLTVYDCRATSGADWFPWGCFLDNNDDVWLYGTARPNTNEMVLWRLTDVTGLTDYAEVQRYLMPVTYAFPAPVGYFTGSSFVGVWGNLNSYPWYYSFAFELENQDRVDGFLTDGVLTTYSGGTGSAIAGSLADQVPPTPNAFYLLENDGTGRTLTELMPNGTRGATVTLDDWDAGDTAMPGSVSDDESTVLSPVWLDGRQAFAGIRHYFSDQPTEDDQTGDFFVYYLVGDGDGEEEPGEGTSDSSTLRVWQYALDGHDKYILRLGTSATLVYDLSTDQWSEWASPEAENWRAHVGQNWVGMGAETIAREWGTDIVAGDDTHGVLYILDPEFGRDEDPVTGVAASFERVVTGGLPADGRETMRCGAVTLALSAGAPVEGDDAITLETSDDLGHSWLDHGAVTLSTGAFGQTVEWRALGLIRAPGRAFRLTDYGAVFRLSAMDMR